MENEIKVFKSFFKTVGGNEGTLCKYPTRLDTYGCGCFHDCSFCLDPDTPILMYDGTVKPLRDIEIGDEIYGVTKDGRYHKYTKSTVLNKWTTVKPAYRITLDDGRTVVCSGDHRWLTTLGWKYTKNDPNSPREYLDVEDSIVEMILSNGESSSAERKIVSIEQISDSMELLDITTSTENFIANGLVSHNCYGKSLLEFRKLWNADNPAVADLKAIERKIARLPEGMTVRMGGMTDCFQPCETEHRVTYETIKMLNERGIHQLIVTKSHLPATDKYLEILSPKYSHLQFSVTNTDDNYALEYERASKSSKRLEAMKICADAGLDSCLRLSPYIHGWIDLETIAKYNPPKVLMEFLRVNTWIAKWFGQRVNLEEWSVKSGGYRHLPLDVKIAQVDEVRNALPNAQLSMCEDNPEAYEYWQKNVNCNPVDCCNLRK